SCTVVICTRNRAPELDRCLAAVKQVVYPKMEVLVVDNAPSDESSRKIAERWGVDYVVEPRQGLSRARNLGLQLSSNEIVAFIDDDAVPSPEWLHGLCAEFSDPQ